MGLMGQDACGICQGDHHYTAHPDWRERMRSSFTGGAGGSGIITSWEPGEYRAFEREFAEQVVRSFAVPMIDVTAIGDTERTYLPGPAEPPDGPYCAKHPGRRWAVATQPDGRRVRLCGCELEPVRPVGTCPDCHLGDQELWHSRCLVCHELAEIRSQNRELTVPRPARRSLVKRPVLALAVLSVFWIVLFTLIAFGVLH